MTDTFKKLAGQQLPNAAAVIYTVPASTQAIIRRIKVVSNGTGATFTLWHGTSAVDANLITPAGASVSAGGFAEDDDVICMSAGETIRGVASVAGALTITLYGDEVS